MKENTLLRMLEQNAEVLIKLNSWRRSRPKFEPRTSHIRGKNHASRPTSLFKN